MATTVDDMLRMNGQQLNRHRFQHSVMRQLIMTKKIQSNSHNREHIHLRSHLASIHPQSTRRLEQSFQVLYRRQMSLDYNEFAREK